MLILPLALVAGSLTGWAVGGDWRRLTELRFRYPVLVFGAIAAQVALELPGVRNSPSGLRFAAVVISYVVVGWWLLENVRTTSGGVRYGISFVVGGWSLNLLAIASNGGMPVSESALRRAGIAPSVSVVHGHLSKHVLATQDTTFRLLGDLVPLPWLHSVVSPGDILMAVGIGAVVAATMRRPAPEGCSAAAAATATQVLMGGHS
jgi:hypothetical protein